MMFSVRDEPVSIAKYNDRPADSASRSACDGGSFTVREWSVASGM